MCGFEQEATLLGKMSPQAHTHQTIILLSVCVSYTTYVGKSDHVSQVFHGSVKSFDRSNRFVSLHALQICKHTYCTYIAHCDVVPTGKHHFNNKWSKRKRVLFVYIPTFSALVVVRYVYRKKRGSSDS